MGSGSVERGWSVKGARIVLVLVVVLDRASWCGVDFADESDCCPIGTCQTLPRSGSTKQPRILTWAEKRPECGGRSAPLGSSRHIPPKRPTSGATFPLRPGFSKLRTKTTTSTSTIPEPFTGLKTC